MIPKEYLLSVQPRRHVLERVNGDEDWASLGVDVAALVPRAEEVKHRRLVQMAESSKVVAFALPHVGLAHSLSAELVQLGGGQFFGHLARSHDQLQRDGRRRGTRSLQHGGETPPAVAVDPGLLLRFEGLILLTGHYDGRHSTAEAARAVSENAGAEREHPATPLPFGGWRYFFRGVE
jgi:hypothetical protein